MITRIVNATIVNENSTICGDILIKNGRIKQIDSQVKGQENETIYDAKGNLLLPGMIDMHVHFREPGIENKGTIKTESRAAVSGGITSIMEMPNTKPAAITNKILEDKYKIASESCLTNYSFYLGASNSNLDELKSVDPKKVCGIKLFLGSSTGNLVVDNKNQIAEIFEQIKIPIALHCEVDEIIKENEIKAKEKYGENIPFLEHGNIRSRQACLLSTQYAIDLAEKHNTQIHILHMTTSDELKLFKNEPVENKKITVEACPHHLWFSEEDYSALGSYIKCNPAIKTLADRNALREALKSGFIDTVGTDHAPHLLSEKDNTYFNAPSGMPIVQSALPSLLEYLSPEMVAEKTSHNPAKIYKCLDRGFIREGYFADLTVINMNKSQTVNKENILYKCGWSPFNGIEFKSTIDATFVNGKIVYEKGKINDVGYGMRLLFDR